MTGQPPCRRRWKKGLPKHSNWHALLRLRVRLCIFSRVRSLDIFRSFCLLINGSHSVLNNFESMKLQGASASKRRDRIQSSNRGHGDSTQAHTIPKTRTNSGKCLDLLVQEPNDTLSGSVGRVESATFSYSDCRLKFTSLGLLAHGPRREPRDAV